MANKRENTAIVIILIIVAALILNNLGILDLSNIFSITPEPSLPYGGIPSTSGGLAGGPAT